MKKFVSIVTCLLLLVVWMPTGAVLAAETTGVLENGLEYTIADGEVTITFFDSDATHVDIPSTIQGCPVTAIGEDAFRFRDLLESVTIPDTVTTIGEDAFIFCYALKSVNIPDSVTTIGNGAFYNCSALTSVTIPDSVTTIDSYAFRGAALQTMTIPKSVTYIGWEAFSRCDNLTAINVDSKNTAYCSKDGVLFDKSMYTLCQYPAGKADTAYVVPDSVNELQLGAFTGCSRLVSVDLPDHYVWISIGTFTDCSSLTSITIPEGDFLIRNHTFAGCTSLTTVNIPDSVSVIMNDAFADCRSLTSLSLSKNVEYIDQRAFIDCTGLTAITVDVQNPKYTSVDGVVFNKDKTELLLYPCGKEDLDYTVPNSVTSIEWAAFRANAHLQSVTIPEGITTIDSGTFFRCSALQTVTIPKSVTTIGEGAFGECTSLHTIYYGGSEQDRANLAIDYEGDGDDSSNSVLTFIAWCYNGDRILTGTSGDCTWTLDDGHLTVAGNGAMADYETDEWDHYSTTPWGARITAVTFEEGVTHIGNGAFSACASITEVIIPDSVISIGEDAFYGCSGVQSVTFGNGLTTIGRAAFAHNNSLSAIVIPNSVTAIGNSAFWSCENLSSVTLSNQLTELANGALGFCPSLSTIIIPEGVTTIGDSAFWGCSGMTSIYLPSTLTTIWDWAFADTALTDVYYGGSEEDLYQIRYGYYNYSYLFNATWHYNSTPEPTALYGDADGDGKVNNRDLGLLQQHLADWDVELNLDVCDLNGDGKVNNRDLGILQQYLADWDVELG